jgi:hypothetical protein
MLKWWRGRSEQPDPPAARRPGLQPSLLPRHAGPGHLTGVRSPDDPGVVFFLGQGLLEVSGHTDGPPGRSVMIWIQVRDVRAEHARLAAAGVRVIREPAAETWGLTEMWIQDPDGIRIVQVEFPPITLAAVTPRSRSLFTPEPAPRRSSSEPAESTISPGA